MPILEDAWTLYKKIEDRKIAASKHIANMQKVKVKMQSKYNAREDQDLTAAKEQPDSEEKQQRILKEKFLFKTIMCPFEENCPEFKKVAKRWPDSQHPTVTKMGVLCPYAHQVNELCFPEEFKARIDNISKMLNTKNINKTRENLVA